MLLHTFFLRIPDSFFCHVLFRVCLYTLLERYTPVFTFTNTFFNLQLQKASVSIRYVIYLSLILRSVFIIALRVYYAPPPRRRYNIVCIHVDTGGYTFPVNSDYCYYHNTKKIVSYKSVCAFVDRIII